MNMPLARVGHISLVSGGAVVAIAGVVLSVSMPLEGVLLILSGSFIVSAGIRQMRPRRNRIKRDLVPGIALSTLGLYLLSSALFDIESGVVRVVVGIVCGLMVLGGGVGILSKQMRPPPEQ